MGGLDGEDLMFGLATKAAVCYLCCSLLLMRPSAEKEVERIGHEEEVLCTFLSSPLLILTDTHFAMKIHKSHFYVGLVTLKFGERIDSSGNFCDKTMQHRGHNFLNK